MSFEFVIAFAVVITVGIDDLWAVFVLLVPFFLGFRSRARFKCLETSQGNQFGHIVGK